MDHPLRARKHNADAEKAKDAPSPRPSSIYVKGEPAAKHARSNSSAKRKQTFWENIGGGLALGRGETRLLVGLIILGAVVRLWNLDYPDSVVFDEVHFGGFANKYLQSRFFMDVHPPLAKLLITASAYFSGLKGGQFDFKDIGHAYRPDDVPFVQMRLGPSIFGLLVIPLAYLTLRGLQVRPTTALVGALMVMFDNALITQSRFILLDPALVFFTALSIFFWVGFSNEDAVQRDRKGQVGPFSKRWWVWLILTGLSLGAVLSCKWVGLFSIATVGICTIIQLWGLLGDLRVPMPLLFRHFMARAVCLIGIPMVFYMAMFSIHFSILSGTGDGDGFMSSEFQHTLRGHGMADTFADVMVGSHITIRHANTQGGYLHSHPHNYPGGSKQQQVTLYPHADDNNIWVVLNSTKDNDMPDPETHSPPRPVMDKARIVLHHITTSKKLHSHDVRAPVTEVDYQNEVSAYGFEGFEGDANDHFQIEIEQSLSTGREAKKRLEAINTKFRLRHLLTGCYLFSHKVKLPDWGFEQQEVTCNKNPSKANSIWYIETNTHKGLPTTSRQINYAKPSFLKKFLELQAVMWRTNNGLTERHAYDSRPDAWPFLRRGINFWVKDHRQIYLIGNPIVWWTSTLCVVFYIAVRGLLILRAQRGYSDFGHSTVVHYDRLGAFLVLGWFMHYFPFWIMGRQLFLHHYLPALYFSILVAAVVFDLVTSALKPKIRLQAALAFLVLVIYVYWTFAPLAYGSVWTKQKCQNAKWRKNWDFSCNDFLTNTAEYYPKASVAKHVAPTAPVAGTSVIDAVVPGENAFVAEEQEPVSSDVPDDAEMKEENDEEIVLTESTIAVDPRQTQDVIGAVPAEVGATNVVEEKIDHVVEKIVKAKETVEEEKELGDNEATDEFSSDQEDTSENDEEKSTESDGEEEDNALRAKKLNVKAQKIAFEEEAEEEVPKPKQKVAPKLEKPEEDDLWMENLKKELTDKPQKESKDDTIEESEGKPGRKPVMLPVVGGSEDSEDDI